MPTLSTEQVDGIGSMREIASRLGAALNADQMGFGKTPQGIGCVVGDEPALCIVPPSLRRKWRDEFTMWRPDLRVEILEGQGMFRWPTRGEVVITSEDILPATKGELARALGAIREAHRQGASETPLLDVQRRSEDIAILERRATRIEKMRCPATDVPPPAGMVAIVDEAHTACNAKSLTTARWRSMRRRILDEGGLCYPLTATPLLNDPLELSGMLSSFGLLDEAYGGYFGFLDTWGGSRGPFGLTFGEPNDAKVAAGLRRVGIRRLFDDYVKDVPAAAPWQFEEVDLEGKAGSDIDAIEEEWAVKARCRRADLWRSSPQEMDGAESLRRVGGKVAFEMIAKVNAALAEAKLPGTVRAFERFERFGVRCVVAGSAVAPIKAIGRMHGWASITGSETPKRRHEIVAAFRAGDVSVAFTHRAGAVGIDLVIAALVAAARGFTIAPFFNMHRDWVPSWNDQAMARVRRRGQTMPTLPVGIRGKHPLETRLDEVEARKRRGMRAIDASAIRPSVAA